VQYGFQVGITLILGFFFGDYSRSACLNCFYLTTASLEIGADRRSYVVIAMSNKRFVTV